MRYLFYNTNNTGISTTVRLFNAKAYIFLNFDNIFKSVKSYFERTLILMTYFIVFRSIYRYGLIFNICGIKRKEKLVFNT